MMKRALISILFLVVINKSFSQFEAVDYAFSGSVKNLMLNPGAKLEYNRLIGVPFLSNTQIFAGNTGFSLYDLFAPESSFDEKFYSTLDGLKNTDFVLSHFKNELFNYGWTDDLMRFKYFGMYWEFDHITYFPADLIRFGVEGNAKDVFKVYDAKYLASKTEFVQTMYFGINKSPSADLNIGFRIKLYSGIANAQSVGNSGSFYTKKGTNNFYTHYLNDIEIEAQSSGYNEDEDKQSYYLSKFIFSGNYGPGFDFGLTYQYSDKTSFSFSVLDLGFIYYAKDLNNYKITGNYRFEGVQIEFPDNYVSYWDEIKDEFNENVKGEENDKAYISFRPTSIYVSVKYGLGDLKNQSCNRFMNPVTEYTSYVGLTAFTKFRPVLPHLGVSGFYEKKWSDHFYTKVNLSIDNFSYSSIGAGMVWNLSKLQFYLSMDNLYGLSDLAKSRKQSLQFGINLINF